MSNAILDIKKLIVDFRTEDGVVRAVDQLDFSIPQGKTIGLVGESGSGKSVTSLAIMKLLACPPAQISGDILFLGESLLEKSEAQMRKIRGNRIAMIFQEPMTSLNPVFNVGSQISESLILHKGLSKRDAWEKSIFLMDQVGIPNPAQKALCFPHELSGGQKQRVMIAMAMSCEPELLICDEPTTALDVTIQKQVLELMLNLQEKFQMSMLFITHDLGVVADLADDVVVMYKSKMVEKGKASHIFQTPAHPYTKGLIACRPQMDKNPERLLTVSNFMDEHGNEKPFDLSKVEVKPTSNYDLQQDNSDVVLSVRNLKTYFPIKAGFFKRTIDYVKAVDDVSFELKKGKTLGLVGESGCGKTTLGRTILRLIEPTAGQVLYKGEDVAKLRAEQLRQLRSKMQIIFQDPYSSLNPRHNIEAILTEPMVIHSVGSTKKERKERASYLMEKVGLTASQLTRYPHEFSGGQRQRICIARALTLNPDFIVCDESVSALDVSVQAQVLNLLLDLQQEFNLTYIFISHDLSVVNFISDEVAVMNQGQIVEKNSAYKIYHHCQHPYTQKLLSAIPEGKSFLQ